jgi:hypothetical protein
MKYDLSDEEVQDFIRLYSEVSDKLNTLNVDQLNMIGSALKGAEPINDGNVLVTKNCLIVDGESDISLLLRTLFGTQFNTTLN